MISETQKEIENFGSLDRMVKIGPKTKITLNAAGYSKRFYVPSIEAQIGIGRDHTAYLVMDLEAWEALKNGEEIDITTLKEFKENFL